MSALLQPLRMFETCLAGAIVLLGNTVFSEALHPLGKADWGGGGELLAVVGVFSGVGADYDARRAALRLTWFPDSEAELATLERQTRVALRFVIGAVQDAEQASALLDEEAAHGKMLRVMSVEKYNNLPLKLLRFFEAAITAHPSARYLLKVDDDVYLFPAQLQGAVGQWVERGADLVGCFMQGKKVNSYNNRSKWYEPSHALFAPTYHTYPSGPTYAVSASAARLLLLLHSKHRLRFLGCGDDCSVGLWLTAINTTWLDDRRMCAPVCSPHAISVRGESGLGGRRGLTRIATAALKRLHTSEPCQASRSLSELGPIVSELNFDLANCPRLPHSASFIDRSGCRDMGMLERSLYSALSPAQRAALARKWPQRSHPASEVTDTRHLVGVGSEKHT